MAPVELDGRTIVITGATGQVAEPVAIALAAANEVVAGARFRDAAARERLEAAGVRCVPIDLLTGDVSGLPADADYVVNFAVAKSNEWEKDLRANSGGLAYLMEHHQRRPGLPPLLDDRASTGRWATTCSPRAIRWGTTTGSGRSCAPTASARSPPRPPPCGRADRFGLPTTIARLSVPYGDRGGWPAIHLEMMINGSDIPVHVDAPSVYHPIHEDDIIAMVPGLLGAAGTPATVVNWGGSQSASIEEWCGYLGELTGLTPTLRPDHRDHRQRGDRPDPDARAGRARPRWPGRTGCAAWSASRHPELLGG